jgi:hypothetical protein
MSTIILSVVSNTVEVAKALILISTGVVLFTDQPIPTSEDVNNVVLVPPEEYFETT